MTRVIVAASFTVMAATLTQAQSGSSSQPAPTPTFTKDVLPILQKSCQTVPPSRHVCADVADVVSQRRVPGRAR